MKKTNKIALVLSLLALSFSAYSGPYLSGQVGAYGAGNNNPVKNLFDNDDSLRVTGRIAGGYLWDVNDCFKLGMEAGGSGFQDLDETAVLYGVPVAGKLSRWSADLLAVADYNATSSVDLFAKAGPAYVREKLDVNVASDKFSHSHGTAVPKAVVGVGYNVADNINLNLSLNHEFKRTKTDSAFDSVPGASSVLAGIKYSFS